ncbi:hypothetical protein VCHENC01_2754 [Vibrio harveyi]|nr:hypothetical protein VCHENC01_2754 [Vibrio harveyi]
MIGITWRFLKYAILAYRLSDLGGVDDDNHGAHSFKFTQG